MTHTHTHTRVPLMGSVGRVWVCAIRHFHKVAALIRRAGQWVWGGV